MSFFDRQHQLYKASTRVFDVKTNKFYTKAFYGATRKEVDDKLANFKKSYKDNKLTFGNIAQAYLLDRLGRIKEETVSNYQGRLEKHFIEIWDYSFARIDYKLIQNLLNKEKENGKSNNQLNDMISLFGTISMLLFVLCLIFFIIGLKRKNYQDVFFSFKLNNGDRENMVIFLRTNILYVLIIFIIVITSLLFNYKLF